MIAEYRKGLAKFFLPFLFTRSLSFFTCLLITRSIYTHTYTHIHITRDTCIHASLSFGTLAHMLRFTWFLAYRCDKKIQGIKIYHVTTSLSFVIDEITRETTRQYPKAAGTPSSFDIFTSSWNSKEKCCFLFLHVIFLPFFEKFSATLRMRYVQCKPSFYITIFRVKNRKGFFKLFRSLRFVIRSKIAIS